MDRIHLFVVVVVVAVDDLVRVKLNDMMMNVFVHLMEMNTHSEFHTHLNHRKSVCF